MQWSDWSSDVCSSDLWHATGTDIDDRKRAEDRTRNENIALREDIVRSSIFEEIVGSSEPLRRVLVQVSKVAPTDSTVLVLGETGTGKELIARAIHNRSKRSNRSFHSSELRGDSPIADCFRTVRPRKRFLYRSHSASAGPFRIGRRWNDLPR